ncbi:heat-inducible transcriptional repressor HrcA [Candidatus Odyssella acanthamoebae]|uniref:Heat-inducible transcription repressor HrcA n=1 Tax=Candidatus Odyssella acanthamoebae TaxID=91604 RepID=A0A077AZK4_9PROT|nr:heat-inducible transcriptional repressor HrcA [Candidatus Paracaedibacter acanthamoebae]AIK97138.1 heat-inducible transcription repressor [Candidatus Paracaedibacter acanthamoebae]
MTSIRDLNERSLEIFKELVDAFMETGEPVGSRTLSRRLTTSLSPATIRNVMADLEEAGLLYAPHTSAGRLPTEEGLKLFVHGLLQIGDIGDKEREELERRCHTKGRNLNDILENATSVLSGLSQCAGLVMAPKTESPLKHIEFVPLSPTRALVVTITQEGLVENRVLEFPEGIPPSILVEATNYLNAYMVGHTLSEARQIINRELVKDKQQLNALSRKIVADGVAVWSGEESSGSLIIKGQANLLNNVTVVEEIDQIRNLFNMLDTKENLKNILDASVQAEGVQIFIGAESPLFSQSGCSMVIAPYRGTHERIIGAIGVVGPSRMNYGRVIPLVDYTAKLVSRLLG